MSVADEAEAERLRGVRMIVAPGGDGAVSVGEGALRMSKVEEVVGFAAHPAAWCGNAGIEASIALQLMVMDASAIPGWLADGGQTEDARVRTLEVLKLSTMVARELAAELLRADVPPWLPASERSPRGSRRSRARAASPRPRAVTGRPEGK